MAAAPRSTVIAFQRIQSRQPSSTQSARRISTWPSAAQWRRHHSGECSVVALEHERRQVRGKAVALVANARHDDAELAAGPQEDQDLGEVRVVAAEVVEGVEAHDRVEVPVCEGELVRLGAQRDDTRLAA